VKTQLIQLDPHDDFVSVKDRMNWSQAARILIVWSPDEAPLLDRALDLLLLKRHADRLGAQLAFVTTSPAVKFHARRLHIPVFKSALDAQDTRWLKRRRPKQATPKTPQTPAAIHARRQRYRPPANARPAARLFAALAILLTVAAFAAVILPSAQITLTPETRIQAVEFTAITAPGITAINASGAIPARTLVVTLEGVGTVETTGSIAVPGEYAGGRVTFTNLTADAVSIPQGTIVLSGGGQPIRYLTSRAAAVDAAAGATVEVAVTAAQPGSGGNLPAAAITAIEGELGLKLTVSNAAAITGGTDASVPAPTDLDRRRGYRELLDSLRLAAAGEIAALLAPGDILLTATPFLAATLEERHNPAETVPADLLETTLRLEFHALVITRADLEALGRTVLDASLPAGFNPSDGGIDLTLLEQPEPDSEGNAQWLVRVEREIKAARPGGRVIPALAGLPPEAARDLLAARLQLAAPPEIRITPNGWRWLPLLPVQIQIIEAE
jgi:hypothetical protein